MEVVSPLFQMDDTISREFLSKIYEGADDGLIGVVSTPKDNSNYTKQRNFDVTELDAAIDYAHKINSVAGQNVAFTPALLKPGTPQYGRTTNEHFYRSRVLWVDCDDIASSKAAKSRYEEKPPNFVVVTGREANSAEDLRIHLYWLLMEFIDDGTEIERLNKMLAERFNADRAVTNPGRIMRLAGTIAHPKKSGRVTEKTELHRPGVYAYFSSELEDAYNVKPSASLNLDVNLPKVDAPAAVAEITTGSNLHDNTKDLICKLVGGKAPDWLITSYLNAILSPVSDGGTIAQVPQLIKWARDKFGEPDPSETSSLTPKVRQGPLPLVYAADVAPNIDVSDFVENLLTDGGLSVCYGASNSGKTFFATDLALHVALGWTYQNRFEVEQGGVVYCALEGGYGIKNRVAAFKQHHNLTAPFDFAVIPSNINLFDPNADTERLIEAIETANKFHNKVRLVVVDTLARAIAGGNENVAEDMGLLIHNADRIREATGAHVMFIHHSGKDATRGARGSSALRAATDTELEVDRNERENRTTVTVTKQRDMEILSDALGFNLEVIELGTNKRGKAVTSCVVAPLQITNQRRPPLTRNENLFYEALVNCFAEGKGVVDTRPKPDMPVLRALVLEVFTNYLKANAYLEANANGTLTGASRTKKSIALNALRSKGYTQMTERHIWLITNEH